MATPVGAELQRLLDDREIERLLFEYCRCADANDPDGLARCFTENCVARYGPGPPSVGADARREQAERDLAMFSATSHHLSNVSIDHVEDGRARAVSRHLPSGVPPGPTGGTAPRFRSSRPPACATGCWSSAPRTGPRLSDFASM
jgi:hypothetical protein